MGENKEEIVGKQKEAEVIENKEVNNKSKKADGMAITSMILGILAIVSILKSGIVSLVSGILAIVFYSISKKNNGKNGMATTGLILGIVSVAISTVMILIALIFVGTLASLIIG